ncbi:MAG: signal peptidase I [Coriobacteriia bacterium]|nr:signal peptidase I [Coriobacteriia bacterium]
MKLFDPDAPFVKELPDVGPDGLTDAQRRSHRIASWMLIPLFVVLLAIIVPLYVLYDVGKVDGDSMNPTLRTAEYLLITRGLHFPQRGDVVIMNVNLPDGTTDLVKRIVALPNDRVKVIGDRVWVNGAPEAYPHQAVITDARHPAGEFTIPPGHVYVMGDNRPGSSDSRELGWMPVSWIHGKVIAVWFPVNRIRQIPGP